MSLNKVVGVVLAIATILVFAATMVDSDTSPLTLLGPIVLVIGGMTTCVVQYPFCERTANQECARFIAKDVRDYAKKVPAGLFVDSQTIKKVIAAAEGTKPHTQTVARIMDFLADLGGDGVTLKKRRGKKFLVFNPDTATRCIANHDRCDRGRQEVGGTA